MSVFVFIAGAITGAVFYAFLSKEKQINISDEERKIFQIIENSKDIIYYFEVRPKFKYKYISPSLNTMLGKNLVEDSIKDPYIAIERIHPEDLRQLNKKVTGKIDYSLPILQRWKNDEGKYIWFEEYTTPIYKNEKLIAILGIKRNIDEKIKLQETLEYKATHDSLTGIYNRDYFEKKMEEYDTRNDVTIGFIICDLDGLKQINDMHGHKLGDTLICNAANLLNSFSDEHVMVTRIGGDEFAILVVNKKKVEVELLICKIEQEINHYNRKHKTFVFDLSIGFEYAESSLNKMEQLFKEADRKMYSDKFSKKLEA